MIKFEKAEVWGFEHAIRGMRNPMNSWDRSDSYHTERDCVVESCDDTCNLRSDCVDGKFWVGDNDKDLMIRLIRGGAPHRKFLRQIFVSVDITAPLYWWKEFDTYKVGTTANSCSTMHKIMAKSFEKEDFSFEKLDGRIADSWITDLLDELNELRDCYLHFEEYSEKERFTDSTLTKKDIWYITIQMLPTSYNQKRTVTMTYENLLNMLEYRRGHKLDEWREFCNWILTLPHGSLLKEGVAHEPG